MDVEKRFFGPTERRLTWQGFLRAYTYYRLFQTNRAGIDTNMKGDGTLLGGVFVLGPDSKVLYEHREGTVVCHNFHY